MNYDRAYTASWLARIAYRPANGVKEGCKRLGMTGKLVAKDGAEVVIAKKAGELWFAFRGTEPTVLNDVLADLDLFTHRAKSAGRVHGGFQDEVDEVWAECLKEIDKNAKLKKPKALFFTGHSLGGAMATVAASRCNAEELYTFGSPRVGNRKFVDTLSCPHYRFVNNNDIVCKVPPALFGFRHDGECVYFNAYGNVRNLTRWQRFKDFFRGVWIGWRQGKVFDSFTDHGIANYTDNVEKNESELGE